MTNLPTKEELDRLVKCYETVDFIPNDPVQFPHKYRNKKDIEIAGFIASLVSYGKRELFIAKLNQLTQIMQDEPLNFILNFEPEIIGDFNYRFGKPNDFSAIFSCLKTLYNENSSLEDLFCADDCNTLKKIDNAINYFYNNVDKNKVGQGFYHMLPKPANKGAMKRVNMFLRWMIRKSEVDLGIWSACKPSELLIPLDVHVGKISRKLNLLSRKANDMRSVIELTEKLKEYCPDDPIKYDFALFGYGVNNK